MRPFPAWCETPPTSEQQAAVDDAAALLRRAADHIHRTTAIHGGIALDWNTGRALAALLDGLAMEAEQIGPNPRGLDLATAVLGEPAR